MMTRAGVEWLVIALFAALIAVVFQQINTNMAEQGIAAGSPYDNAAAYPKAVAIGIGILIAVQAGLTILGKAGQGAGGLAPSAEIRRGAVLVGLVGLYLFGLGTLGYHISTIAMIAACLYIGGLRKPLMIVAYSVGLSLFVAAFFEVYLKIVLPGGIFGLNIAW